MIDKNKPLLASDSAKPMKTSQVRFNHLPFKRLAMRSLALLALLVIGTGVCLAILNSDTSTESAAERNQTTSFVPTQKHSVAKPALSSASPTSNISPQAADQIIDQAIATLAAGPATQASIQIVVQQPEVPEVTLTGTFLNLGQSTGFSKTGILLDVSDDSEGNTTTQGNWIWQISRGKTSLRLGAMLGSLRSVQQQPSWLNTQQDDFQKPTDCYGSPISMLQWVKQHFHLNLASDQSQPTLEVAGELLPRIAQSWGDGTHLNEQLLQRTSVDPQWLVNHVHYPLPHQIHLRFSNQPNTARTLLQFQTFRFVKAKAPGENQPAQTASENSPNISSQVCVEVNWSQWQLAPQLSPADFPIQLDQDKTAVQSNNRVVR